MENFFDNTIVEILVSLEHVWLFTGITAFLYLIRAIPQANELLFLSKWRGLIPIINLILSSIGVFVLNLTTATTTGLKCVVVLLISAVSTYGYELTKPIFKKVFKTMFGQDIDFDKNKIENKIIPENKNPPNIGDNTPTVQ